MLKKYFFFLILNFLLVTEVNASGNFLECPVEVVVTESECNSLQSENAKPEDPKGLFRNKFDMVYQEQYLEAINNFRKDNRSNSNFLAEKAIYELRVHKECLRTVCDVIFKECGKEQDSQTGNFGLLDNNQKKCRDMLEDYFEIQKNQMVIEITENQYRKNRSLLKQKLTAVSTRFQVYLLPYLSKTARELKRLEGKIDGYIKSPKE